MVIDLKKEQAATLSRRPMAYSRFTRLLFWGMDVFYGAKLTFGKMRLLEILARIPYQAWEIKQYHRMNSQFPDPAAVESAEDIIRWGRDAQDNEFWQEFPKGAFCQASIACHRKHPFPRKAVV